MTSSSPLPIPSIRGSLLVPSVTAELGVGMPTDLKDLMREAGEVTYADAHNIRLHEGVVEFASYYDMRSAIERFDGYEIYHRKLRVYERRPMSVTRSIDSRSSSRSRSLHTRSSSRSRSLHSRSSSGSRSIDSGSSSGSSSWWAKRDSSGVGTHSTASSHSDLAGSFDSTDIWPSFARSLSPSISPARHWRRSAGSFTRDSDRSNESEEEWEREV